jgi:TM2 domain-containing membrane protein YozV
MKNISIKTVILYIWLVFSIIFVIWSAYNYFQISVMQKAYIAGQNDTIVSVIQRAQNKDCKPFNVYA